MYMLTMTLSLDGFDEPYNSAVNEIDDILLCGKKKENLDDIKRNIRKAWNVLYNSDGTEVHQILGEAENLPYEDFVNILHNRVENSLEKSGQNLSYESLKALDESKLLKNFGFLCLQIARYYKVKGQELETLKYGSLYIKILLSIGGLHKKIEEKESYSYGLRINRLYEKAAEWHAEDLGIKKEFLYDMLSKNTSLPYQQNTYGPLNPRLALDEML